ARVRRLRSAQIPQHIGMAAACRALAVELPRALTAQLDADLASGVLAQRWEAVRAAAAEPGASGDIDSTLFALALLLREQGRAVGCGGGGGGGGGGAGGPGGGGGGPGTNTGWGARKALWGVPRGSWSGWWASPPHRMALPRTRRRPPGPRMAAPLATLGTLS